jgi:alkylation response protein AidB-like acyl-CoA dehydrogenase
MCGQLADGDLRVRIAAFRMQERAFHLTVRRAQAEARAGGNIDHLAPLFKYAAASVNQQRLELLVETLGLGGLGWEGDGFDPDALRATRHWLRSKGNSIEGGTSEINLNVVAKRVLGLPDPT